MLERRRLRVYIAGPISTGDMLENVHRATVWGRRMVQDGLAPYVPHLDAYMLAGDSISWNAYLEWDAEWLAQSEVLFRLDGDSRGADVEEGMAMNLGLPIYLEDEYQELLDLAEDLNLDGIRT